MMTLLEVFQSARTLASQFRGGIAMSEAVSTMAGVQPGYQDFWEESAQSIEGGNRLSAVLPAVWPGSLVSAVVAGEESGNLPSVFTRIAKTVEVQLGIRKSFLKLLQPTGIAVGAVLIFINIMVFLVPMTVRAFASRHMKPSGLVSLAFGMEAFFLAYWWVVILALLCSIGAIVKWLQSAEGRETALEWMLGVPLLGGGLKLIYFGVWADYLGLMYGAGIPVDRAVTLSMSVLPVSMRTGFEALLNDITVNSYSISDAINPARIAKINPDDPRLSWPLFIRNALKVGAATGNIDEELSQIAPELTENGVDAVNTFVKHANVAAIFLALFLIGMCYIAIYLPMFQSMQRLR